MRGTNPGFLLCCFFFVFVCVFCVFFLGGGGYFQTMTIDQNVIVEFHSKNKHDCRCCYDFPLQFLYKPLLKTYNLNIRGSKL